MSDSTRLMLIDGHSLVHRAFHALAETPLMTSSGEMTGAVFGFSNMLLKAIDTIKPTHVIMAMDRPSPTFRHEAYAEYKATRPRTPQELVSQFRRVREVAEAMNIPIYEQDGFEADDVLGTLSSQASADGIETVIVTGDRDALQLVDPYVHVFSQNARTGDVITFDVQEVENRYGIEPRQVPDWKALVGDTSDNIPGVPGIGQKTASSLVATYGSLEGIYEHVDGLKGRVRAGLEANKEQVFRSRDLATIVREVPVALNLESASLAGADRDRLMNIFLELEFRSLMARVQDLGQRQTSPVRGGPIQQLSMFEEARTIPEPSVGQDERGRITITTATPVLSSAERSGSTMTRVVQDREALAELVRELTFAPAFAMDTETTGTDPLRARLVGLSFATEPGRAWYVPVGHAEGRQVPIDDVLEALRPIFEDEARPKIGHNLKYEHEILSRYRITLLGLDFDTMIAAYLVNPNARGLSLKDLALARLGVEMTPIESLIGKGKSQITMDLVDINTAAAYAGADADMTLRLKSLLERELSDRQLTDLFTRIEMPLVSVLADMEQTGVALDPSVLAEMSKEMTESLGALEGRIYEIAGRPFNISSTQQLGQILFGELKLPAGRRTKTGYSTDSEVLENLRGKHEIVDLILDFRQLLKLKNTYIDALPSLVNPEDGRIHTDFNQTVAATGRLSSSNPNLQNIPIRGEIGRKIRRAFVPSRPGHVLLAADYSQIELRILAAMSHDPRLVSAFAGGEDVHRATAAAVFGVPPEGVTADQRRIAKVVNFGIIYGIGENRLAHETGITRPEAGEFISSYNATYAGVKSFMDEMRRTAALYGYVSTLMNRRRYMPDIHSNHPGVRQAAERAAINMPIQGTAADIIKLAMIEVHRRLAERFPEAKMVLQVHDELVFDVPETQVNQVAVEVRETMQHALDLGVPIEVEVQAGPDWYDMQPLAA